MRDADVVPTDRDAAEAPECPDCRQPLRLERAEVAGQWEGEDGENLRRDQRWRCPGCGRLVITAQRSVQVRFRAQRKE